jgi:hypothetical protein
MFVCAILVVLFLAATIFALLNPDASIAAFAPGGGGLWMNLFWLLMGIGLALAVRRIWANKK